jgi:hypothetical protein
MADNVPVTAGSGTNISTDQLASGAHVQHVKLMDGTADGTGLIAGDASNGLDVDVTRLPALVAGTANIGDVDVLTMPTVTVNAHAVTVASGGIASGAIASGAIASGAVASGAIASGAAASGAFADGALVTLGAKADAKSTATDTTAITAMQVLKQISASVQAPPSQAVTNAGTFATQATLAAETTKVIGTVNISASQTVGLVAGSAAIGKLAANSGVDIGDVDILSIAAGNNNIGDVDVATIPGIVGTVADDATTPGAPVMVGGVAVETDGTDPTSVSAEADIARFRTDRNRRLLVNDFHPNLWSVTATYSSAQTNQELKATPGANLSLYITDIVVSNGATAGTVKFVESTASSPVTKLEVMYFAINGGATINLRTPIRCSANVNFGITSGTVTTHTVTISGFIAP